MLYLIERAVPAGVHRALLRLAYRLRHRFRGIARPRLRGVAVIVRDEAERVLLVRHSYGSGYWSLPGGGCGRREAPEAAARREMREELALDLDAMELVSTMEEEISGAPHTAFVFAARAVGEPRPDGREIVAAGFYAERDIPQPLSPISARRLVAWWARRAV